MKAGTANLDEIEPANPYRHYHRPRPILPDAAFKSVAGTSIRKARQ
jgi:hypothetical protein